MARLQCLWHHGTCGIMALMSVASWHASKACGIMALMPVASWHLWHYGSKACGIMARLHIN